MTPKSWLKYPFYPLALALYPALSLASVNQELVSIRTLLPALALSLLLALALLVLLTRLIGSRSQAGLILALGLVLFYSYGHVAMLIGAQFEPLLLLPMVWAALFIGGYRLARRADRRFEQVTMGLNVIGLVLVALPLLTLFRSSTAQNEASSELEAPELVLRMPEPTRADQRDIYIIVLDGYGRADTLRRIYDYDNGEFLGKLEEMGFFIADGSFANYNQTILSLPAMMNFNYLQQMDGPTDPGDFNFWALVDLAHHSQAFALAERAGYETVAFEGEHVVTAVREVDTFLTPPPAEGETPREEESPFHWSEAERFFWETTALRPLLRVSARLGPEDPELDQHRRQVRFAFSQLSERSLDPDPQFVYAHVLSPHPPFVFEPDGEPRRNDYPFTIADASHWVGRVGSRQEYIAGYRAQIEFVNQMVLQTVEAILANAEQPPIILIQGDHGPGSHFIWNSQEKSDVRERMAILTAVYIPPELPERNEVYAGQSPVNSMRLVFNAAFQLDLPLVADRAYFSPRATPFDFAEVTELVSEPGGFDSEY
ncbi:MAG: sulfatase-like hydrolase/transferase [Anaerolineales bacterium]|nr:sulfatase-like hydrolase/transferase [Anaerolineales bacterium]